MPAMFVHVMDPSSQALTLQVTAWGSKDLKHCKGALGATRPSAGTNATTYTSSVHCDRWSTNEFQLRLQSDLVGKSQSRQRSQDQTNGNTSNKVMSSIII